MEQRTDEWYLARKGKFTASEIVNLTVKGKKKDDYFGQTAISYIYQKASEYVMPDNNFILNCTDNGLSGKAVNWGVTYEDEAREEYEKLTNKKVIQVGFIDYDEYSGVSPDGIIESDNGLIEIKCPFDSGTHIKYLSLNNGDELKELNKQYWCQVQFQMLVTNTTYCDFISYDLRQGKLFKLGMVRVYPDKEFQEELKGRITKAGELRDTIIDHIMEKQMSYGTNKRIDKQCTIS